MVATELNLWDLRVPGVVAPDCRPQHRERFGWPPTLASRQASSVSARPVVADDTPRSCPGSAESHSAKLPTVGDLNVIEIAVDGGRH